MNSTAWAMGTNWKGKTCDYIDCRDIGMALCTHLLVLTVRVGLVLAKTDEATPVKLPGGGLLTAVIPGHAYSLLQVNDLLLPV